MRSMLGTRELNQQAGLGLVNTGSNVAQPADYHKMHRAISVVHQAASHIVVEEHLTQR